MRSRNIFSVVQHCLSVLLMCACVLVSVNTNLPFSTDQQGRQENYGYFLTGLRYFVQIMPILSVPFMITNLLGLVTMNTFPLPPVLQQVRDEIPFMLFRVVTRGLYPELVKRNVERNIETCHKVGLSNFKFEIVTDNAINLKRIDRVRELVVPTDYVTRNRSMYKARALHYCTEPSVNIYELEDWVIHLDEETLLTKESVIGLANFASQQLGDIGQGVISYANEEIVNWWTTLADSVRVSIDLGMMRFSLRVLGCPLMGFKGSFIIANEKVEKDIGFDFGPKGSVAEDVMFALKAWSKGYKFNFVDGEMWEKSTFSLMDYIKQRKRWFVGHYFTIMCDDIPLKYKLGILPSDVNWFLVTFNLIALLILRIYNVQLFPTCIVFMSSFLGFCAFCFIFGTVKSFSLRKYGFLRKVLIAIMALLVFPLAGVSDGVASLLGFITRNDISFYIVKKDRSSDSEYANGLNSSRMSSLEVV